LLPQHVVGIHEFAKAEGKAAAPDTPIKSVPQVFQADDPLVKVFPPGRRDLLPIPTVRRATVRQSVKSVLDPPQWNTDLLGSTDKRDAPEHLSVEAPLVASRARAVNQAFTFVKVQG
jgi:hypothetical protein